MTIKSVQDQIFKNILSLREGETHDKNRFFFVEGKKQIEEIPIDWNIKQIFVSEKYENDVTGIKNVVTFSERLFKKLASTKSPQGIMAVVEKKHYDIKEILKNSGVLIVLESIQDPGNLGTIIRSADAFAAKAVFISKGSVDVYLDKTIRATMGSIFHLPVINNIDTEETLAMLKEENITIFAATLNGTHYLSDCTIPKKSAFIIGNEAHGLNRKIESLSDLLVKIHMPGNSQSLNVAVAASIIMYEISKK
ncbi:MAG: RNA methyltransferase [Endomicrobium sp.]|jgi:TrmH family RNA methyltransferase|nr:RNA methyltransferase [Endomicrobium sp.]